MAGPKMVCAPAPDDEPTPIDTPSVKCTVEYGGGFFVGTPEAELSWRKRREELAEKVILAASRGPILREFRGEGGPCLFVAPLTREDDYYWYYEAKGPADRMSKSNADAHVEACPNCNDYKEEK